ncbi:polysaccharide biosynthesis protein [Tenacibaculum finnmarkense]|uniref:SDR family NAD(P)-dependent oxidoreductase n=1 Tax=Tenacibaculum finnmarkense genomovar finnmarkense TaxID=1458503 RepID=A0AAP1REU3_9FLAO|nr:nucleoside-diphosphate sugar epimerase/dehydratase [Tenacibaculum finnmarkense]MBE7652723.1 SDR family NAD(P)-dependent oxidoreductase [Tenacibaculum finnmarkense genomovar finnmarkense]MBE7695000.1 SDR family NAD(P)-dependent oxidoreductase [Tenacibaculum finnmarkense genomovar finnmarkense]MCD8427253.1 polysaccharide biosynthesis protein [Tenacibaculum finnmarkense genomovar finnmarkense]MCG8731066.1 polysaccharide biosynthesis protein [Tenacibaculum finnmarkense]MCG8751170.1 polysacchari
MPKKIALKFFERYASKWVVLSIDIILVCISFILAYSVRFNASLNFDLDNLYYQIPFIACIALISFLIVGSYRGIVRHTGTRDAFNVFLGVSLLFLTAISIVLINNLFAFIPRFTIPLSILIIHYLISILALVISRYVFKAFFKMISTKLSKSSNVLIYGSGDSGLATYEALDRDTKHQYNVLGFIDDNEKKSGKKINQVKIYNRKIINKEFIENKQIDDVIISIQNIKSEKLLFITDTLLDLGVKVKIVPPISKWIDGDLEANQIKTVKIEDLLNRKPISIENPIVKKDVNNKVILVTGAAGSIGSEISRQLSAYQHEHLVLIDQAESALYDLQQELVQKGRQNITSIVADVRDETRMSKIFEQYKPQKVFHAAAYKHVPLMEMTPYEAVKINIAGTKNIADLSIKHQVERFVMVSTDKAVNPTNVMGATKRVAEMYISCLSNDTSHHTKFTITRFGNVLGSNGSVIPLFKRQIENGGPLTVTHKDITRYFMTIPEACCLVLEAGTMGNGGEIYIFDMGKSVKIYEIAKRMIHLSGLKFPEDIDIKITGLRPGEKLYEELLADGENTAPTYHEKIMIAKNQVIDTLFIRHKIAELCVNNKNHDNQKTVQLIKEIVPEYISKNSIYEKLDAKVL